MDPEEDEIEPAQSSGGRPDWIGDGDEVFASKPFGGDDETRDGS